MRTTDGRITAARNIEEAKRNFWNGPTARKHTELRNWIERSIGKQFVWSPAYCGNKGGRKYYSIDWTDGTNGKYYIDFENQTIEPVEW